MKLLILASLVTMSACADGHAQSWKQDAGSIFAAHDGGWTTYSDLAFVSASVEHVRVNQHDKLVTITRDGADAGWKCRIEQKVEP